MADAGRNLVLGLGMGVVVRRDEEEAERGRRDRDARRELEFGTGRCGARSSPEPAVRLTLLPGLGLPWPPPSSETNRHHLEASSTRGFDVNRAPSLSVAGAGAAAAQEDEEQDEAGAAAAAAAASSSPNNDSAGSFPTDFSAQGQVAPGGGDRACSRASDDDDGGSARKKLRLSKEQSAFLEESFKEHATLNPKQKLALAKQLNLRPRQVEVWFQNRRARTKLKQTEVDCEYLKRCCETLTEENRRLQKELAELRALKTVHPFYMHLPATTLSMCPSCERVASNSAAPAGAAPAAPASSPSPAATGIAASSAPEQQRPSSFAALFSSPLNRPLAAQAQPQPQAPATS
ncbi:unnamed protein product [Miscanthus lutarioriparius]|uniref:Homeobox domain-containing protein n=1 Tax=Miscanthus lutarioriparius TaxID=422564 RepID=A0A811N727_9POAL|nr:unnamed protein product [Miscanthus lutarioriparius]